LRSVNSRGWDDTSPGNGSVLDNISQLTLATSIFLTVFTIRRSISNTTAPFRFHLNILIAAEMFRERTCFVSLRSCVLKLTGVNDKMAEYTSTPGVTSLNAALMHTLQRHRDILQDYTHEFHKTKSNFMAIREREDLLGSVRKDIDNSLGYHCLNIFLFPFFLSPYSSDRLIDDTISIAMATKENMTSQRGLLKSIQSRVNTLANRFPAINNLIQRINLRKRRDSLILGGVIGICTILLLLYAFH
uniref:Golgi SNAP receptor complex member 1 n=1 Tax=Sinocyclocheilus grahami TaxID=75366 RepID=A0A672SRT1_SINGR